MASNSSKALPFLVILIVSLAMVAEVYYQVDIDLETLLPFFIAIGITGGAKAAIQKAAEARKSFPKPIEDLVKRELEKIIEKGRTS